MFFRLLDLCYEQYPEDDLGGFLGSISPELWDDGKPADIAVYHDWKRMAAGSTLTDTHIIGVTHAFLENYEQKFGFDFSHTKHTLLQISTEQMLAKARAFADKMNETYHYPDYLS